MIVGQEAEKPEGIAFPLAGIKDNNLVFVGLVVVFVKSQEFVDPEIGEHGSDAVQEDIGPLVLVFLGNMMLDPMVDVFQEILMMGVARQGILNVGSLSRVVFFLFQKVAEHGRIVQELLLVQEGAKFLKKIQHQHIHVIERAYQVGLELLYLLPDTVFVLGRVLEKVKVVEQIPVFRILETGTAQLLIEFLYGHANDVFNFSIW